MVALAGGVAIVALLLTRHAKRNDLIAVLLAACWLWTGEMFLHRRYAQINWVASYVAVAYAALALLLLVFGTIARRIRFAFPNDARAWSAATLFALCVVGYPLLARLDGRAWTTAEVFGVAPDPTALATLALVALIRGWLRWVLLAVPLAWCAMSAGLLWAMEAIEAYVVITVTVLALALTIWNGTRRVNAA
jgi:hypothetical protein